MKASINKTKQQRLDDTVEQEKLVDKVNSMPDEIRSKVIKQMHDIHMHDAIDKFDCKESKEYLNDSLDRYKLVVNEMISFCTASVPKVALKDMSETEMKRKRRAGIKQCVDEYKARVINKCNENAFEYLSVTCSLDGFKEKRVTWTSPFLDNVITLESVHPIGSAVVLPQTDNAYKTLRIRIEFGGNDYHLEGQLQYHGDIGYFVNAIFLDYETEQTFFVLINAEEEFHKEFFKYFVNCNSTGDIDTDTLFKLMKCFRLKRLKIDMDDLFSFVGHNGRQWEGVRITRRPEDLGD